MDNGKGFVVFQHLSRKDKVDLMSAWLNKESIERFFNGKWDYVALPAWNNFTSYRVRPKIVQLSQLGSFGSLTNDGKLALMTAWLDGGVIEGMAYGGGQDSWTVLPQPDWLEHMAYRVAVVPLTKPSVNWEHVSAEYNWLFYMSDGGATLSPKKPERLNNSWTGYGSYVSAEALSSFVVGTCDWKDSLTERPKK